MRGFRPVRLISRSVLLVALLAAGGCEASKVYGPPNYCEISSIYTVSFSESTKRPAGATALLAAKYSLAPFWTWEGGGGGFNAVMDRRKAHEIGQEPLVESVRLQCNSPDPAIRL